MHLHQAQVKSDLRISWNSSNGQVKAVCICINKQGTFDQIGGAWPLWSSV